PEASRAPSRLQQAQNNLCLGKKLKRFGAKRQKKSAGESGAFEAADGSLWQHVANAQITHTEVSVLGCAGGHKPGRAGQVRSLCNQQEGSVLRVSPEGLRPGDRALLNGAVGKVG